MKLRSIACRNAVLLVGVALALGSSLSAVTSPSVSFSDTKLKNGLRLLVSEDHVAPTFSIAIVYNVGSRDERPGRSGFAHLFEHMMFKGSENVGPGEHSYAVRRNGGPANGQTNTERTLYFETMPSNQLEAAFFLEADRMRSLTITQENFDNQRNVVQEERRLRLDNQPYGRTFDTVQDLALDNAAYKHPVLGSMEDLNAATVDDVAAFFRMYYAPNNAIVAVVGDVTASRVRDLASKYFEPVPGQPAPPAVDIDQPAQTAERRATIDDALARVPRLTIAYRIPSSLSPDDDALGMLSLVLASGRTSRLTEAVVRQKQLAANVNTLVPESRGPRLWRIGAAPVPGKSVEEIEAAIYAEIERIKSGPIADWEMEKARNGARRSFVGGLESTLNRAIGLAEAALMHDNPNEINARYLRLDKVSATDIQRVARQYLTPENRTVVITRPRPAAARGGRP